MPPRARYGADIPQAEIEIDQGHDHDGQQGELHTGERQKGGSDRVGTVSALRLQSSPAFRPRQMGRLTRPFWLVSGRERRASSPSSI